jgi:hypothetical protein
MYSELIVFTRASSKNWVPVLRPIAQKLINLAHDLIGEPISTSPDHALAGNPARCTQPEYSAKSTDWLKAAFTLLLHAAFTMLRFIFDEARALMVKPRLRGP